MMKHAYPQDRLGLLVLSNCSMVDERVPMDSALIPMRIHKIEGCRRESKQNHLWFRPILDGKETAPVPNLAHRPKVGFARFRSELLSIKQSPIHAA